MSENVTSLNEYKAFKEETVKARENIRQWLNVNNMHAVEYQVAGKPQLFGAWVPRSFNSEQIKKVIKGQVKIHGGRWLGKFTIASPERQEEIIKMMEDKLNAV